MGVYVQGRTESNVDGRCRFSWKHLANLGLLIVAFAVFSPIGCSKKPTQAKVPAAPPMAAPTTSESKPPASRERTPPPPAKAWTQLGIASWYVPEPAGRRTASGERYEPTALTAAHCTLPLNTLVRVTNLSTQSEAIVRINDRGPFMAGRVIDLSVAAAKALGVWRPGIAKVKLEVVEAPMPIETGGRWCIQIGAFRKQIDAQGLKETVSQLYRPSRVLAFAGSTGYWVRVLVKDDDRARAQDLASKLKVEEGGVFLVRLD
jgi:rare lipoprotein A